MYFKRLHSFPHFAGLVCTCNCWTQVGREIKDDVAFLDLDALQHSMSSSLWFVSKVSQNHVKLPKFNVVFVIKEKSIKYLS